MPKKQTPWDQLGSVEVHKDAYRVHLNYREDAGNQRNIYGPERSRKSHAKADLDQIRAVGSVGRTRKEGQEIMAAEANRIQISARYGAQLCAAVRRLESQEEEEAASAPSDEEPPEEPWLEEVQPEPPKEVASTPPSQKTEMTPLEATAALKKFRPIKSRPADLERILSCRADPN